MRAEMAELLRRRLTPEQREAAIDAAPVMLTLACAGSGKSRTLAYRVARLIDEGCPPSGIVAFTFTEKAAADLKTRIAAALIDAGIPGTKLGAMYIGTIHSYCQFLLKQLDARFRQFDVLDENRLKLFLMSRYAELNLGAVRDAHPMSTGRRQPYFETIRQVADAWKVFNDEMLDARAVAAADPLIGRTLNDLSDVLDRDQFLEFSSMVRRSVELLEAGGSRINRVLADLRHVMVDEYQDVNPSQERLIQGLRHRCQTLFAVGDDDQAIYGWRGADVDNILTFDTRYPGASVHTLATNFRSTSAIVQSSTAFVKGNLGPRRRDKSARWQPSSEPEDAAVLQFSTRDDEAQWVAERIQTLLGTRYVDRDGEDRGLTPGDFAVLMRSTKRPSYGNGDPKHQPFTAALDRLGIACTVDAGGGVLDRPHAAAVVAVLGLLRAGSPTATQVQQVFQTNVAPSFPAADLRELEEVLAAWGRRVHQPAAPGVPRQRIYPQQLLHEVFAALGVARAPLPDAVMFDLGTVSRIIQDVEAVYVSIDSRDRFGELLNFLTNVGDSGYDPVSDDVLQRPDAVFVSTVHKAKGLEFPVVFIVDVEARRFPLDNRAYSGWLPQRVLAPALRKGRYQTTLDGEVRLFYAALTRAERFLYVTSSMRLPGNKKDSAPSRFTAWLQVPPFHRDPSRVPQALVPATPRRRIEEALMPSSFTDLRYYLRCPKDYEFRKRYGFSPPIADLFGFGQSVHAIVGRLHDEYLSRPPNEPEAEAVARHLFHLKHVPPSRDPENRPGPYERARERAAGMARDYVRDYRSDFERLREVEARFEVPVEGAVISGSIDLLLREDDAGHIDSAEVVDFKAMGRGDRDDDLREEREPLRWSELALQIQLYAKAARDVLGERAETGSIHLLKDGDRVQVPVDADAVVAAIGNVEWAVQGIMGRTFPMRPHHSKCLDCDFTRLCPKQRQEFPGADEPPPIAVPTGHEMAAAFSQLT